MAYAEFPSTNYYDYDLKELIGMYKKVTAEYTGLVNDIASLRDQLTRYQNAVEETVSKQVSIEVSRQLFQITTRLTVLDSRITRVYTELSNSLNIESKQRINADKELQNQICELYRYIKAWTDEYNVLFNQFKTLTETKLQELKIYLMGRDWNDKQELLAKIAGLQEQIDNLPDNSIPVLNPVTGENSTTSKALSDIWNYGLSYHGFTSGEWQQATYITCDYFNDSNISAVNFFTHAKTILRWADDYTHVYSYITGDRVSLQNAIYEIYGAIKANPITAKEYDAMQLTAQEYDNKNVKGYCFDNYGKEILSPVKEGEET